MMVHSQSFIKFKTSTGIKTDQQWREFIIRSNTIGQSSKWTGTRINYNEDRYSFPQEVDTQTDHIRSSQGLYYRNQGMRM